MYIAITMDIKSSRTRTNRSLLQDDLLELCSGINETFYKIIVAKFDVILGDEVQGLIKYTEELIDLIFYIKSFLKDKEILSYMGIGFGEYSTDVYPDAVYKMDGPCFHEARASIEKSKKQGQMPINFLGIKQVEILNGSVNLYYGNFDLLSDHAFHILKMMKTEMSQSDIAHALDVKQSSVSRSVRRYLLNEMILAERSIKEILKGK